MRKIEDILNELRAHPNMAHFEYFTFDEVIDNYIEELEYENENEELNFNDLDFNYTFLTDSQKDHISSHIRSVYEYAFSHYEGGIYGSIDDIPLLKKAILKEVKLNALLSKKKDEDKT